MTTLPHAGLDWTATPSLNEPFAYGPGVVAVPDGATFEAAFCEIHQRFGISGKEIKGHNSSIEVLDAVLQVLIDTQAKVGVLLLDKSRLLTNPNAKLPSPAVLRHQMACVLLEQFLASHPLAILYCDEDIRGQKEQQAFKTEILRCKRALQPYSKMKISMRPSHKSVLIQAADVLAYVYSRELRGALAPQLRRKLDSLRADTNNLFLTVTDWEEVTRVRVKSDLRP
jgi:hypothetical protein